MLLALKLTTAYYNKMWKFFKRINIKIIISYDRMLNFRLIKRTQQILYKTLNR